MHVVRVMVIARCVLAYSFDRLALFYTNAQFWHPPVTVADAEFLEGGFWYIIARKARAKFLKPCPLSIETPPIFDRETSCLTCQSICF